MAPSVLYTACVLGALGLYLVLRPGGSPERRARRFRAVGAIVGLAAFAWLIVRMGTAVGEPDGSPDTFFVLFSLIATAAAVKMITHGRPVYSALYFVLVVLASAGLFLLLEAEFMAFALIIVYAGAILITYMFVLMLAQQSPDPRNPAGQPEYDLYPREPAAGAVVGFILLALLTRMIADGTSTLPEPPTPVQVRELAWDDVLGRMPARVHEHAARVVEGDFEIDLDADGAPRFRVAEGGAEATVDIIRADGSRGTARLTAEALPENVQALGLALIREFPVSLELAGVILLMAMYGAVVLARRQIELTEDEKREAAGMRRLGHHDEPGAGGAGGAA